MTAACLALLAVVAWGMWQAAMDNEQDNDQ